MNNFKVVTAGPSRAVERRSTPAIDFDLVLPWVSEVSRRCCHGSTSVCCCWGATTSVDFRWTGRVHCSSRWSHSEHTKNVRARFAFNLLVLKVYTYLHIYFSEFAWFHRDLEYRYTSWILVEETCRRVNTRRLRPVSKPSVPPEKRILSSKRQLEKVSSRVAWLFVRDAELLSRLTKWLSCTVGQKIKQSKYYDLDGIARPRVLQEFKRKTSTFVSIEWAMYSFVSTILAAMVNSLVEPYQEKNQLEYSRIVSR